MDTIKSCDLRVSLQTGLKESSPNSYGMAKMTTPPMFIFFFFGKHLPEENSSNPLHGNLNNLSCAFLVT